MFMLGGKRSTIISLTLLVAVAFPALAACGSGGSTASGSTGQATPTPTVAKPKLPAIYQKYHSQLESLSQDPCMKNQQADPATCAGWVTRVNSFTSQFAKDPDYAMLTEYAQKDARFAPIATHAQTAITSTIPKAYADYNNPQDHCAQANNPQAEICNLGLDNLRLSLPMITNAVDDIAMMARQQPTG